ncbi:hypothetical protein C0J52_09262 [Blattella germanica]|nr:hypothetical protein C0J52_09262 [Blattella germanica]
MKQSDPVLEYRVHLKELWPPRSPDHTQTANFLWGVMKRKVYVYRSWTPIQLKYNIEQGIVAVSFNILTEMLCNMEKYITPRLYTNGYNLKSMPKTRHASYKVCA